MNIGANMLNKILTNQIQQHRKWFMQHRQVGLFQECKVLSIQNSINVIQHINRIKDKNYMTTLLDTEAFDKIQLFFFIKKNKLRQEQMEYFSICNIYKNPTANIIFNGESPNAFPLQSETRKRCTLLPLLFNIILGRASQGTQAGKSNKKNPDWRGNNIYIHRCTILY